MKIMSLFSFKMLATENLFFVLRKVFSFMSVESSHTFDCYHAFETSQFHILEQSRPKANEEKNCTKYRFHLRDKVTGAHSFQLSWLLL